MMTADIRKLVEIGNHYGAYRQWNSMFSTFWQVLHELVEQLWTGMELEISPRLRDVLEGAADKPIVIDSESTHPLIPALRAAQGAAHQATGILTRKFVTVFQAPGGVAWLVVYCDREPLMPFPTIGDCNYEYYEKFMSPDGLVPAGRSHTFVVRIIDGTVTSVAPPRTIVAQMGYCLSHLGQAGVSSVTHLYMEHQILNDQGIPTIMAAARNYQRALLLRPDDPWTLARVGEVYRTIANGWPGSTRSLLLPERRVEHYVIALLYYRTAFRLNPDDHWAHAHFGAAVVNVRGFTQIGKSPSLQKLLDCWFPNPDQHVQDKALLDMAHQSLRESQWLRGGFYPWAQVYSAGILVISGTSEARGYAADMAQMPTVEIVDAYSLQPTLSATSFEPGALYMNPFFQEALQQFFRGEYGSAWSYARSGMRRLFNFNFIPGLDALLGFQLLLNISAGPLRDKLKNEVASHLENEVASHDEVSEYLDPAGEKAPFSVAEIPIPLSRWGFGQLAEIIGHVVRLGERSANFFLEREGSLNANVRIGLVQTYLVFLNLKEILKDLQTFLGNHERLLSEIDRFNGRISSHISISIKGHMPKERSDLTHYMLSSLNTGKPSYAVARALQGDGPPSTGT